MTEKPQLGQRYRIPWRCDKIARVTRIWGGYIGLVWVDDAWRRTEPGIWCLIADFVACHPILMEDQRGRTRRGEGHESA